jgi:hypothetical protein
MMGSPEMKKLPYLMRRSGVLKPLSKIGAKDLRV